MSPLFEPLEVGGKVIRNRIVMPPMVVNRDLNGPDGREWYGRRARGGVGLVIVQATSIMEFGKRYTARTLRPLADAIHDGGALAAMQGIPDIRGWSSPPAELTAGDIAKVLEQFRTMAEALAGAGFDGIEPHGAHGYVLNQFFSPAKNARTDEYGENLPGRMRLAQRIVETLRPVADEVGMLVLYRHTPVGEGYGIAESKAMADRLVKAGVDILDMSPSSDKAPGDLAAPFMQFGVPVIAVNRLNVVERAVEALKEKRASLVAVGRGLIADPDWALKVREGRFTDILECDDCSNCFGMLWKGQKVGCVKWPGEVEP